MNLKILGSVQNAKAFEKSFIFAHNQALGNQFVIADPETGGILTILSYANYKQGNCLG